MIGVVLAGGEGTRLRPLTYVANKHLLPVYDQPMIYYPLQTLADMGCTEVIIVSGGNNIGGFADLLKDGRDVGLKLTYKVQTEAGGIAQALGCVEGMVSGLFPVILGDNYFSEAPEMPKIPTIYVKVVSDPSRFGVYHNKKIIEKPRSPKGNRAVVGLYVYDEEVFKLIKRLVPSERGELEITDVNNWYIQNSVHDVIAVDGLWSDMGTFESLLEVANYVSKEKTS